MNRAISMLLLPFLIVVAVLVMASVYIVDVRQNKTYSILAIRNRQ